MAFFYTLILCNNVMIISALIVLFINVTCTMCFEIVIRLYLRYSLEIEPKFSVKVPLAFSFKASTWLLFQCYVVHSTDSENGILIYLRENFEMLS